MAFNLPVQNYFTSSEGLAPWVRPSDWPVILDNDPNAVQYLFCDLGDANCSILTAFSRTSGFQNILIDWGDGTTNTITATANTRTNHQYTVGSGTPCSLGYTTFVIKISFTGTGVSVLNTASIGPLYISNNTYSGQVCYALEAYFGDDTTPFTPTNFYSVNGNSPSRGQFTYLKYVKYRRIANSWTNTQNLFNGATSLARVQLPVSMSSVTASNNMFHNCYELEEVVFPSNATAMDNFTSMFQNCFNLRKVTLPTTLNSCITFSNAFSSCINLKYLELPSLNVCTVFTNAFTQCWQLAWVKFTSMPTANGTIFFTTAFAYSYNLQNVYFPATGTTNNTYSFQQCFIGCAQLKSITLPSNINASTFLSAFGNCVSLVTCVLPTNMPSCTQFSSIFTGCYSLKNVTLPNTAGVLNMGTAFNQCYQLESITIPNTLNLGACNNMFSSCSALKTINWNPGTQNSLTSLASAFSGCSRLTSIQLPTSMTALNSLSSTFSSCRSLKSVTFPSSLNAVTTLGGAFIFCSSLETITFPSSMSACNNFAQTFQGCEELRSVVFPNTVSTATTTFTATFINCYSLESVVFPGAAQLSSVTQLGSLFSYCSNLKTITNFDKIGSLTNTPLMDANSWSYCRFTNISFSGPLSKLGLNGSVSVKTDVQSVRLLNTSTGQWTGSSPQIDVTYTNMSTAQLIQLFNDMAAQGNVSSKTINITGATGTSGLTLADRQIITTKGWTITG